MTDADYALYHEADVIARTLAPQEALAAMRELARTGNGQQHVVHARMVLHALEIGDRASAAGIERELRGGPETAWAMAGRAWYAAYDNRIGEAEAWSAQALRIDEKNACALSCAAFVACLRCNFVQALDFSSRYVATDPANPEAFFRVFWTHLLSEDSRAAAQCLSLAPAAFLHTSAYQTATGHLAWRASDLEGAARCFHRAIKLNPLEADGYAALAAVLAQLHLVNEARDAAAAALELDAISVGGLLTLAGLWQRGNPRVGHHYERLASRGHPLYVCVVDNYAADWYIEAKEYATASRCLAQATRRAAPLYLRRTRLIELDLLRRTRRWRELAAALRRFESDVPAQATELHAVVAKASLLYCEGRKVDAARLLEKYLPEGNDKHAGIAWLFAYLSKVDEPQLLASAIARVLAHPPLTPADGLVVLFEMFEARAIEPATLLLDKLLASFPDDKGLRWMNARRLDAEGDAAGAMAIREKLPPEWVAWIPRTELDDDQPESLFRRVWNFVKP